MTSDEIIREIFSPETGWFSAAGFEFEAPNYSQLEEFAGLLASDPAEELLQSFLARHPQVIAGNFGWGDDATLAFFVKPPVGTKFKADFGVLHYGQGGCVVHLLEVERSSHRLFNKDLAVARPLRDAAKQIEDWHQWITLNRTTFIRDALTAAKSLPHYRDRGLDGSYRTRDPSDLDALWQAFGGYDDPAVRYHIVIGRWSRLRPDEQKRLLFLNRQETVLYDITTYDQLARRAFDRPTRRY